MFQAGNTGVLPMGEIIYLGRGRVATPGALYLPASDVDR
jgi:hypothetical protein